MTTTIQVHDDTLELLKLYRKSTKAASYDETIKVMIKKATAPRESLKGFLGKRSMKYILEGLRDKTDRF